MDAAAELGRNPVSKHQIQPEYGDEQADAGRDGWTRLARPNSQARTGTGEYYFPCSADHEQDWQPYPVDPYSAICDDHTYIHRPPGPYHHGVQQKPTPGQRISKNFETALQSRNTTRTYFQTLDRFPSSVSRPRKNYLAIGPTLALPPCPGKEIGSNCWELISVEGSFVSLAAVLFDALTKEDVA